MVAVPARDAPGRADLPRLTYLGMVIKESMRIYPPALAFGRETSRATEAAGYELPPNTNVIDAPWVVHRDSRWVEQPERFWPERWADGLAQRLPRFAYFPFSGGPRLCIGQSFALMETALILATVLQQFQLVLEPGARV